MNKINRIKNQLIRLCGAICFLMFTTHCVEPVEVNIPENKPLLIVEGLVTDEASPYEVKLSRSTPIGDRSHIPVGQAEVIIEDGEGMSVVLKEDSTGLYLTDSAAFRGQIGQKYRLLINLKDGNAYQSEWVILKKAPPIDSVSFEYVETNNGNGAQLYVHSRDIENKTHFYRWEWEETWVHIVPFPAFYNFLGNDQTELKLPNETCWNTNSSKSINIASSLNNAEDIISAYPLHFVSTFGGELRHKYSILVKQYALSDSEFLFWKSLKEANEDFGTLFDRQPQSTVANIVNIHDEDEAVLGYFSVSGVSEKRIFIDRSDLPSDIFIGAQYISNCYFEADTLFKGLETDEDVFDAIEKGWVFYDFFRVIEIGGWILVTPNCSDCTVQGGKLEKPDYWID